MAKLGEVCLINPKSCTLRDDTEVSFIPMTKVGEHGEFDASEIKNYSEVKKGFTNFQNGDILFAKITPCMENGKGAIAHNMKNGIGFGSTEFHVLRPDTDKITSEWLYYLTTWKTFRKEAERNMTGSAGQKRVPKTFLENYVVNLPDIDTQKSENKILRKVDDLIFLRKQQLAKLDELIKARFVEMFGDLAAPQCEYPELKLVDVCADADDIKCGPFGTQLNKDEYKTKGVAVWEIPQINSGFSEMPTHFITEEKAVILNAYSIEPGDIAMSRKGNVGKCGLFPENFKKGIIHSDVLRIRVDKRKVDSCFMMYQLHFSEAVKRQIEMVSSGAIMAGINVTKLKQIKVRIPELENQRMFAVFVERVDQQKQTVQQSLEKLELMKKALMQEYFG